MISQREQIIGEVLQRCQNAVNPFRVLRQPTLAVPRELTPVLIMAVVSDTPVRLLNELAERELVLRLISHVRDPGAGFAMADMLLCQAHAALLRDASLGGLALGIVELEADYQAEDADGEAIAIPATYRITYRTLVSDISQQG